MSKLSRGMMNIHEERRWNNNNFSISSSDITNNRNIIEDKNIFLDADTEHFTEK